MGIYLLSHYKTTLQIVLKFTNCRAKKIAEWMMQFQYIIAFTLYGPSEYRHGDS